MSEMLGNQYFMARNYTAAQIELDECLLEYPDNKNVKKKLIICYIQTGNIPKATDLFISLIKEDIEFIVKTDLIEDDCPCPELINKIEKSNDIEENTVNYYSTLGIIWLYCSIEKSLENFEKALELDINNPTINKIIFLIKNYIKKSDFSTAPH